MDLGWGKLREESAASVNMSLKQLATRTLTLTEAAAVTTAVTAGKAGYMLQLCQFTLADFQQWDATIDRVARAKAGRRHAPCMGSTRTGRLEAWGTSHAPAWHSKH